MALNTNYNNCSSRGGTPPKKPSSNDKEETNPDLAFDKLNQNPVGPGEKKDTVEKAPTLLRDIPYKTTQSTSGREPVDPNPSEAERTTTVDTVKSSTTQLDSVRKSPASQEQESTEADIFLCPIVDECFHVSACEEGYNVALSRFKVNGRWCDGCPMCAKIES